MEVLLTSATPFEIAPAIRWLEAALERDESGVFRSSKGSVEVLVTGVGMLATGWRMGARLAMSKPGIAIQAGIGGALDDRLKTGEVLHVTEEILADLGAEDRDGRLLDLFDLGLAGADDFPFDGGKLKNPHREYAGFLPEVCGITVNRAHGTRESIDLCRDKYPAARVESMEGAAFFYACLQAGQPFISLRSISNKVEPRNREAWNIPLAIENLNGVLVEVLKNLV